jgi:hypothetical protein
MDCLRSLSIASLYPLEHGEANPTRYQSPNGSGLLLISPKFVNGSTWLVRFSGQEGRHLGSKLLFQTAYENEYSLIQIKPTTDAGHKNCLHTVYRLSPKA